MTTDRETMIRLTEALFSVSHNSQHLVEVQHQEPVVVTEEDGLVQCEIEFGYYFDELCIPHDPGDLPEEGGYIVTFDPASGHVVGLRGHITRGKTSFGGGLRPAEYRRAYEDAGVAFPEGFDPASVPH